MGLLNTDTFICLDCETTGLDPKVDRIIEIAVTKFTFSEVLESFETLVDPEMPIPEASIAIHHITPNMVHGKPKIQEVLPQVIKMVNSHLIIGHGIQMDLAFLTESAKRTQIPLPLAPFLSIDTLRMARLYGGDSDNQLDKFSLDRVRQHFNIPAEGAHRAMGDVTVNISVFKHLATSFKTTQELLERLKKPILLKNMPLGKYKSRPFAEIPIDYLKWVLRADFDQDLHFSIQSELQKRKRGDRFEQATNPFSQL